MSATSSRSIPSRSPTGALARTGRTALAMLVGLLVALSAAEFHVAAANGNDGSGDGSAGNPFATITRGLAAVVSGRGDTVTVHAGTYRETVRIVKGGQSAALPLRLRGAPGETVVVSGLDPIGGWSLHSGSIHQANVPWSLEDGNASIDADKRDLVRDQLFVDGLPQVYARWPNVPVAQARAIGSAHLAQMDWGSGRSGTAGYVSDTQAWFTDAALGASGLSAATIAGSLITFVPGSKCFVRTGRLSAWNGTTATVLAERLLASNPDSGCSFAGEYDYLHAGCDYHLWGKLGYLDAPGEWFRDPATKVLYARMPDSAAPSTHLVEMRRRDYAILVDDPWPGTGSYDWIEISGLRVIGATIHAGRNCDGVVFRDLDLRYLTGGNDLRVGAYLARWNRLMMVNGTQCAVLDSSFTGMEGGLELNGRGNVLRNCVFADNGAIGLASSVTTTINGDSAGNDGSPGQRNRIEGCTFLGSAYAAIGLAAGTDVIANEVVGSHRQGNDLGAITCGPGTDLKGIEIGWNRVHDPYPQPRDISDSSAGGPGSFYGVHGIYFDRDCANALVHHNLAWNTTAAGIAILPSGRGGFRALANTVRGQLSGGALNTELTNNLADEISAWTSAGSPLIAGNYRSQGADPGFVDAAIADYRLRASSAAIDAGVALASIAGTTFAAGFAGAAPDAGAHEGAAAWTRQAGAAVTAAQLAAVTVTINDSDGTSASARIGGLPRGRHLPAGATIRLGSATAGGTFVNTLDPITGFYTVRVSGIPVTGGGVQGVQLSVDGGATWLARGSSSVDRFAITAIGGGASAGFRASGGETMTISGRGFAAPTPATWLRTVTVANPAAVVAYRYPVRISLDTASLVAAGKLQADGRDLRFTTAADGELPYWIESGMNSAATVVWVRIPRVPASGLTLTMSSGDPARLAQSDPRRVFAWFEDFTGLAALPAGFTASNSTTVGGGKAVVAGTTASADAYANFGFGFASTFAYPLDGPYLIESLITVANPTQVGWKGAFGSTDGALGINSGQVAYYNGGWQNLAASGIGVGVPARVGLAVDPAANALGWYEGGILRATRTGQPRPPVAWMIGPNGPSRSYRLEVDEIRIRPFIVNGPAASLGAESAVPAGGYSLVVDGITVPVTWVDGQTLTAITPPAPAGALPRQATVTLRRSDPALSASGTITWTGASAAVGALPAGWSTADVGAVAAAGSARADGGAWTLAGSGADIWGNADAFRFAWRTVSGDATITARITGLQAIDQWTKAGVMMRESGDPGSRHAFACLSGSNGAAFQRRTVAGGASGHTGMAFAATGWVRLQRVANTFIASVSGDGSGWTEIQRETIALPASVMVGLAVTSHRDGTLASAGFSDVTIVGPQLAGGLPAGWSSADLGTVAAAGAARLDGSLWTVSGSGVDIWDARDGFRFAWTTVSGDLIVTARVASLQVANAWCKAGVMVREGSDPGSRHAFACLTGANGSAFQRRTQTGGWSAHTGGPSWSAPAWVRLERIGATFIGSVSIDGSAWTEIQRETIAMPATVQVGLAVTSHADGALCTATFGNVAVVAAPVTVN